MSCHLTLLRLCAVVTSLFSFEQSIYVNPSNQSVATVTQFSQPGMEHTTRLTSLHDEAYRKCFTDHRYAFTGFIAEPVVNGNADLLILPSLTSITHETPKKVECHNWFHCLFKK